MPKETDLSLNEKTFILSALSQSVRLDGRSFDSFRDLTFTFGEEYGLVDVRLGKTRYCSFSERMKCIDYRRRGVLMLIEEQGDSARVGGSIKTEE